jgi:surface polysaccharide O-acyltransferase-like enzyme
MKERYYYLDAVRVLACLMVVFMHSPLTPKGVTHSYLEVMDGYLTAPCIGLFFMVSGALLLPVTMDIQSFMKRRLSKVVWPTLFWTVFYIIVGCFTKDISAKDLLISIVSIPFCAQGTGILWFMYTLIGLYLIAPIISPWLEKASKKTIETYLLIWLISMCYPYLRIFLNIPNTETNMLYYFSGYAGYLLLGYYLHKYQDRISLCKIGVILMLIVVFSCILPAIFLWLKYKLNPMSVFDYLSISIVVMCICWFILIRYLLDRQRINSHPHTLLVDVSNMTFGIYLCHIFIMRNLIWKWTFVQSLSLPLEILFCAIITFLISYIVVKCFSKFPFSKFIIGC